MANGIIEQIVDEHRERVHIAGNGEGVVVVFRLFEFETEVDGLRLRQQREIADTRFANRAQFMCGIGDERALRLRGFVQAREQAVQCID